ncbi:MAG: hypothetical protein ACFE94_09110 [Candidatus Hodarchaeota archaeon]
MVISPPAPFLDFLAASLVPIRGFTKSYTLRAICCKKVILSSIIDQLF